MFYGGGQERNYRPGTENTGMIAGLGEACRLVAENLLYYEKHMEVVRKDIITYTYSVSFGRIKVLQSPALVINDIISVLLSRFFTAAV